MNSPYPFCRALSAFEYWHVQKKKNRNWSCLSPVVGIKHDHLQHLSHCSFLIQRKSLRTVQTHTQIIPLLMKSFSSTLLRSSLRPVLAHKANGGNCVDNNMFTMFSRHRNSSQIIMQLTHYWHLYITELRPISHYCLNATHTGTVELFRYHRALLFQ